MLKYIIRRVFWMFPVLLIVALITFLMMHAAPGGPWDRDPSRRAVDAATEAALNRQFGLDKSLPEQFVSYVFGKAGEDGAFVCGAVCGNLGPSYRQRGRTVQDILFTANDDKPFWESRFGYSIRLGLIALVMAMGIGVPAGILGAIKRNTWIDYLSAVIANIGVSVPNFVIGIFLLIIFAVGLGWVSVVPRSWSTPDVWVIPALVLGFGTMAFTARLTRASMLEVMRQDYVRTARAKGLRENMVVYKHMLRNALIPVITILGPSLAGLITGSFIIETMFGFPGLGREYTQAIGNRDYSMIMGTTLLYGALIAVANLSVDVMYVVFDPRIRLE